MDIWSEILRTGKGPIGAPALAMLKKDQGQYMVLSFCLSIPFQYNHFFKELTPKYSHIHRYLELEL